MSISFVLPFSSLLFYFGVISLYVPFSVSCGALFACEKKERLSRSQLQNLNLFFCSSLFQWTVSFGMRCYQYLSTHLCSKFDNKIATWTIHNCQICYATRTSIHFLRIKEHFNNDVEQNLSFERKAEKY